MRATPIASVDPRPPAPEGARGRRLWEVDTVRGLAVVAMIVYHFCWDLDFHGFVELSPDWAWQVFARSIGSTFAFVLGVSLVLRGDRPDTWRYALTRGLRIFALGVVITAVTWVAEGEPVILFGILHLLGASLVLAVPFLRLDLRLVLAAAVAIIAAGVYTTTRTFETRWLLWLGFEPEEFVKFDWYPLMPWFGVVLLGVAAARTLYPGGARGFRLPAPPPVSRPLRTLGRHSLVIYLVHQPVLLGVLGVAAEVT
jgi:uncharacterized membrane protein